MANRIKESNITPGAVTSDKIAPGTVSASNISPGSITTTQIATDTIASSNIAPGTIANDRLANTGITINGTTIALGASGDIVAGTDWQSVVVADGSTGTTANAGEGYFIDTTSNAHTINLPSSPTQGDEVHIIDYAGTFGTNNVTVGRNGSNLDGSASDGTLSTNRLNVRFVYIDATQGWRAIFDDASENYGIQYVAATGGTVTESGDYKIHTFTGDGCFVVSSAAGPVAVVDYMVVAGGGGRGSCNYYGGGGAGGFRESHSVPVSGCYTASPLASSTAVPVSISTYPIQVGAGGAVNPGAPGSVGTPSTALGITSAGGGGGASGNRGPLCNSDGGSGGGAAHDGGDGTGTGGSGNTPPVSPPQGNPGGNTPFPSGRGAGGGGATASGSNGVPANGGNGGAGATTSISSSPVTYSEGGGGQDAPEIAAAPANSGDGGGTSAGGKGIVIIRYKFQ